MTPRKALIKDIPAIIQLIANDKLGKLRENYKDPLPKQYCEAFHNIATDPNQELVVIENGSQEVIGTLQLSFIQYLTYQGGIRAQIEAVRIHSDYRSLGLGQRIVEWAIDRAKENGVHLVHLTTDKKRPDALHFYENLVLKLPMKE